MTFTYDLTAATDTTRVRFHLDDTVEAQALFSDEEIAFAIVEGGTWQRAVLLLIDRILHRLARESGVELDWLKISRGEGIKFYQQLRTDKRREFGLSSGRTVSVVQVQRQDVPGVVDNTGEYDDAAR